MKRKKTKKTIKVYVIRDTGTGLYYGDNNGFWENGSWIPRCTVERQKEAYELDMADMAMTFPGGLPEGWEAVKIMEVEVK